MFLLVLFIALLTPLTSVATLPETCAALMGGAEQEFLAGEWDLAGRVQQLLDEAPDDFFDAVGATFLTLVAPVEDSDLIREFRNYYGVNWKALVHRRVILEASRVLISDASWEQIWPVFGDDELFEFLVQALLRLEARLVHFDQPMRSSELKRELYVYLDHNFARIPRYETLLAASPVIRQSFSEVMQETFLRFPVSLSTSAMQLQAASWLRLGRLGFEREFVKDWIALTLRRMNEDFPEDLSTQESLPEELWNTPFNLHLSRLEPSIRIFFYRIVMEPQLRTRFYTGAQVRGAVQAQLEEHQQLVRDLLSTSVSAEEPEASVQPEASHPPEAWDEFTALATGELPLEHLQADYDYLVTFRRQIGHRHRTQRIRFTEKALGDLRNSKVLTGLPACSWLSAIQLGPAAAKGSDGIKLLRVSPYRRSGHMDLEVKRINTPWRLFGYRDPTGRFVLDLFHQGK